MGVGMIVDNSIVVLENIYRFASEGNDRMTACVDGTAEVTGSVIASTLTTVAVFVPLGMTGGTAGMMFKDFCLTIAFLILSSLVIALTWVPLLCYMMLDEAKARQGKLDVSKRPGRFGHITVAMYNGYMKVLSHFTYHPGQGMAACAALVAVFVVSCANTNMVLIPDMDQGEVNISVSLPIGSSTEEAMGIAEQVMAVIDKEVGGREGERLLHGVGRLGNVVHDVVGRHYGRLEPCQEGGARQERDGNRRRPPHAVAGHCRV